MEDSKINLGNLTLWLPFEWYIIAFVYSKPSIFEHAFSLCIIEIMFVLI